MAKIITFFLLISRLYGETELQSTPFGLSPREVPLSPLFLKKLTEIGIESTFRPPTSSQEEEKPLTQWEKGLLFLNDFNQKGDLFQKWVEISPIRPNRITSIDKERNH